MAKYLQSGSPELVHDTRRQRRLRPNDRQVYFMHLRKLQQAIDIRIFQRHTFRLLSDTGISGCTIDLPDLHRPAERIDDSVLPPAAANYQNFFLHQCLK